MAPGVQLRDEEIARLRKRLHDEIVPSIVTLQLAKAEHEARLELIEKGLFSVREILVGPSPAEAAGLRGDFLAFKNKATMILVFVVITFGLKVADVLGWTSKIQAFVK